jgi:hypothetical protein
VTLAELAQDFSAAVGAEVRVEPLGARDARVFVPFEFPDGDRLVIRLREIGDAGYETWTRWSRATARSCSRRSSSGRGSRSVRASSCFPRAPTSSRPLPVCSGAAADQRPALSLAGARQIDVRRRPTRPVVRALWRACALRLLRCTTRPRAAIPDRLPAQQPSETTRHLRRRERRPGERRNDHVAPVPIDGAKTCSQWASTRRWRV